MSWSLNTDGQSTYGTATIHTVNITPSANSKLLVINIWLMGANVTRTGGAPTFDGTQTFTDSGAGAISATGHETTIETWYLLNPGSGSQVQVPNSGGGNMSISVSSWIPSLGGAAIDKFNSGTGTGANPSISVTAVAANALMIGNIGSGYRTVPTAGTNYTMLNSYDAGNTTWGDEYDLDTGTAGNITVSFTQTSETYELIGVSFKETAPSYTLTVQSATQAQTSGNVVLSQKYIITVQGAQQAQNSDNIALSQKYTLTVQGSQQAQTSGNVTLTQNYLLIVQGAQQAQTSGNVSLTQHYVLGIQDIQHIQTSNNVELTQHYTLTLQDAQQAQTSNNVTLIQNYALTVQNAQQVQTSDNIVLIQNYALIVQDAQQAQTCGNVVLTQYYVLGMQDAQQIQTSDNIELIQNYALTLQDVQQAQTSDNVTITYNSGTVSLTVQDSTQTQFANIFEFQDGRNGDVNTNCDTNIGPTGDRPTYNYGTSIGYSVWQGGVGLIRFDLSSIPVGTEIISAELEFIVSQPSDDNRTLVIYEISDANGNWIEGTKDGTLAGSGEPCWNAKEADGAGGVTTPWAGSAGLETANTDYKTPAIGTASWLSSIAQWYPLKISLTPSNIKAWCGQSTNNGIKLLLSEASFLSGGLYYSDESNVDYHPKLVVYYTAPLELTQNFSLSVDNATQSQSVNYYRFVDGFEGDVQTYQDTAVVSGGDSTSNFGTSFSFSLWQAGKGLLRFNLNSLSGIIVKNAILSMAVVDPVDTNRILGAYEVSDANGNWIEGTKNGALAGSGEPCWNAKEADGAGGVTTAWAGSVGLETVDTDYKTPALGTVNWNTTDAAGANLNISLDTTSVQRWCGQSTNNGILVKHTEIDYDYSALGLSDHPTTAYRPKLVVYYEVPLNLTQNYSLSVNNATQTQSVNFYRFVDGFGGDVNTSYDTWVNEDNSDYNGGTDIAMYQRGDAGLRRRGLVKFNLSGLSGAVITSAELITYIVSTQGADTTYGIWNIKSANSSWTESEATWNHTNGTNHWAGDSGADGGIDAGCSVSGTDYDASTIGTHFSAENEAEGTLVDFTLDIITVQEWINNNYGIVISPITETWSSGLCSSDHATTAYRPKLVVLYEIPLILNQNYSLSINNASQAQTSDNVAITPYAPSETLTVQNAAHEQITGYSATFVDGYGGNVFTAKDNTFDDGDPTWNWGTGVNLRVGKSNDQQELWRTIIQFSLSSIPDDAIITNTTFSIYINLDLSSNARIWRIYRLKRAWVEGTTHDAPGVSNWNYYDETHTWSSPGAFGTDDCEQTDIGSRLMGADETGTVTFNLTPTTKAGLDLGYGWLIKADTEDNDCLRFNSSDNADTANLPKLTVTYIDRKLPLSYIPETVTLTIQDSTQKQITGYTATFIDGYGGDIQTYSDTFLNGSDKARPNGNDAELQLNTFDATSSLIKFNVSSLSGKTVTNADLYLYKTAGDNDITGYIYSILSANSGWTESGASWNHAVESSIEWAGGENGCGVADTDYNSTPMAELEMGSGDPAGTEYIYHLSLSQVQNWIDVGNYGARIYISNSWWGFASSDHATTSYRPKLVVYYIIPLTLNQNYSLLVDNATQTQTSDNINLAFYPPSGTLNIQNATQAQTSNNTVLDYYGDIFEITHESGDFSDYNGGSHTSQVYVNQNAGLIVTNYGLEATVYNGGMEHASLIVSSGSTARDFHYRFYINFEDLVMADDDSLCIVGTWNSSASSVSTCRVMTWIDRSFGEYGFRLHIYADDREISTGTYFVENVTHWIEVNEIRSTGAGVSDGSVKLYIDDVLRTTESSIKTYNRFVAVPLLTQGATYATTGMSGNVKIDETKGNNNGRKVGPGKGLVNRNASQLQTSGSITLVFNPPSTSLTVQNATQVQTSDNVSLQAHYSLTVQNATQTQTSDNINLTFYAPAGTLAVQNTIQVHTSSNVVLTQHQILSTNSSTQAQISDNIVLLQHYGLSVNSVTQVQTSSNVSLTQNYILTTVYNTVHAQVSDNVLLTQHYTLIVNNCTEAQTADNVALSAHYSIVVQSSTQLQISTNVVLTQHQVLVVNNAIQTQISEHIALTQHQILVIQNTTQLHTSGSLNLTQHQVLLIQNVSQLHTSGSLNLIQHQILVIQFSAQSQISDNVILTQNQVLVVNNAIQIQTCSSVSLYAHYTIVVQNTVQLQTSDNIILTPYNIYSLAVGNAQHTHSSSNVTLIAYMFGILTMQSPIQAHTSGNVTLTQHQVLTVQNTLQLHNAVSLNLIQNQILVIQNASQLHTAGSLILTQHQILTVQNASQLHISGSLSLIQYQILVVQNASHSHTSGSLSLTQHQILVIQNASQLHTAESLNLTQHQVLVVNSAIQNQTSSNIVLVQDYVLSIQNTSSILTSNNVELVQHYTLTIQNASCTQSSDNIVLTQHFAGALLVQNSTHLQSSQNTQLVQHNVLSISNSTQIQSSETVNLFAHYSITSNNAVHSQTANNTTLLFHNVLVVNNSINVQTADNVNLVQHNILLVNSVIQLHLSDNLILGSYIPSFNLLINNSSHSQISQNTVLIQNYLLFIGNTIHLQTTDSVALVQNHVLIINNSRHIQISGMVYFVPHFDLEVDNSTHTQTTSRLTFPNYLPPISFKYRKLAIEKENRTYTIKAENRTLYIVRGDYDSRYKTYISN